MASPSKAHLNPKSKKWIISLIIMLIVSVCVVFASIKIDAYATAKVNAKIDPDFTIKSTSSMSVEANELGVTAVDKAVDENGNVVAYVLTLEKEGFQSTIEMTATISADASTVFGISILDQDETEYLGVRICDDSFKSQFDGRTLPLKDASSIEVGSSVDLISRSTISSQAVVDAVNNAQVYVADYLVG